MVTKIHFAEDIIGVQPQLVCATMVCQVENSESNEALWCEIDTFCHDFIAKYTIPEINRREAIAATRLAYKACGKDPNRYRPSAEALCRRLLKGQGLYHVNTLVDIINLLSLETGFSIGGFDRGKINGELVYGIGKQGEPYEGIGRGILNIEGLPVLRDTLGGIGTPTSDEIRTQILPETNQLLININSFSGRTSALDMAVVRGIALLESYGNAKNVLVNYYGSNLL